MTTSMGKKEADYIVIGAGQCGLCAGKPSICRQQQSGASA